MEIEAKYRITPEDLERVARLRSVGSFALVPADAPEHQDNRYFDTADGRLATARYGLRIRRIGERALVTLKGPASVTNGGVQSRAEHEFPGDNPDPATWPQGTARDLALALTGGAPLALTVAVRTERRILYAERDGVQVAELCLDRGVLHGGAHQHPFTELEIELLAGGSPADIAELAALLARHVAIAPEPRSKLQRATALARDGHLPNT